MKKPTGSATCPPDVKRAHELEDILNQRVGTRDLSDSEFDDDASSGGSSDDEIEVLEPVRTAVARRAPTPPLRRNGRASGADLANKLALAFDPDTQRARDEARSQRSLENTQLLTLSQQLRDAQAVAESLRTQNTILQNHVHDIERARDRAELKLEVLQMAAPRTESARGRSRSRAVCRSHKNWSGIQKVRGKARCERQYPDGGAMTYWVTDSSASEGENDENDNIFSWDAFDAPHHASRSISRRCTPTPGPSQLRTHQPSVSPRCPAASTLTGNAVELVMTPPRGPAFAVVISPAKKLSGAD
jgi:hypothetical protein